MERRGKVYDSPVMSSYSLSFLPTSLTAELPWIRKQTLRPEFVNPVGLGADPWVIAHRGWYYWCLAEDNLAVAIYRSSSLTELGEKIWLWRPAADSAYSGEVSAPELHWLDGAWYIYVAASNGRHGHQRMIVLAGQGISPTDGFEFKAELFTGNPVPSNARSAWAVDGTILEHNRRRYLIWSGWKDHRDRQSLFIGEMENPWSMKTGRVQLCANDTFLWERVDETAATRGVNEAPQVLQRGGRSFVVFSAGASWETTYKLGMLELRAGGDPMNPADWTKHSEPIFEATDATWGVGHCSFTQSPDGSEDWIAYHAKRNIQPGWERVIQVQRFGWDRDGLPVFGLPCDAGASLPLPAGQTLPQ